MKKQPLAWLAVATLSTATAFAQDNPPAPPAPPADHQKSPQPPGPDGQPGPDGAEHPHHPGDMRREGGPGHHRESGVLLGVGVEEVPHALADQLNLPDGFGVLVNFVVPGSAAQAAGVQPDDILKTLNDQMLVNAEQLSTLVRSFPDGQAVTLTAIRKGKEVKLDVKLKKEPLPEGREHFGGPGRDGEDHAWQRPGAERGDRPELDFRQAREDAARAHEDGAQARGDWAENREGFGPPAPPAPPVRDIMRELRPELEQLEQTAGQKAVERLQHEITILRERNGALRSTKLDLQDARIVIRDDKGELELKSDDGKRSLTAKDPQGKVLFSGPVNTPEERKAVPADILPRLDKLEKEEMPAFPETPGKDSANPAAAAATPATDAPMSASTDSF
jgi:hypothetical protein